MLKQLAILCGFVMLSGCNTDHVSSEISDGDGALRIVAITAESIAVANSTPYEPKSLPAAFGGQADSMRQAENLTIPPAVPDAPYMIGVGDNLLLRSPPRSMIEDVADLLDSAFLSRSPDSSRSPALDNLQNTHRYTHRSAVQVPPLNRYSTFTVQADGTISVPNLGPVPVAGLDLQEAKLALFQKMLDKQLDPNFSLEISGFNSKRVLIEGAVDASAVVPVTLVPLTLDLALARAGGIRATKRDSTVIRIHRGGAQYQVPLSDYLSRADLRQIRLIAGDRVFVDQGEPREELRAEFEARAELDAVARDYVYLTGGGMQPGRFTLPFERQATLADALYSEGGFSPYVSDPAQIYLLRADEAGAVVAWHLDAQNAAKITLATQMQLRPNDVVFVGEQPATAWNRGLQQLIFWLVSSAASDR